MIHIGDYTISHYEHGGFWIERFGGEGMQISEVSMVALLNELWKDKF